MEAYEIYQGNPAQKIRMREINKKNTSPEFV